VSTCIGSPHASPASRYSAIADGSSARNNSTLAFREIVTAYGSSLVVFK
jgi:hypothetical protein